MSGRPTPWHILTGEYPPDHGGVSDYTHQVAQALHNRGEEVHVWTPGTGGALDQGIQVHHLSDGFRPSGLVQLGREAARLPGPKRWLVQYVPHAFQLRGANLPFVAWTLSRPRTDFVWSMFHEVTVPWGGLKVSLLSAVQRAMAAILALRSTVCLVSIPAWTALLPSAVRPRVVWAPIPSNIAVDPPAAARDRVRRHLRADDRRLLGHFGTYSPWHQRLLAQLVPELLRSDLSLDAVFLGRGGVRFAADLARTHPHLAKRLHAPEELSSEQVAAHLAACDVLLQPFPDGASSRRTSLMAGLALGRPVITNRGQLSEDFWTSSGAVAVATTPSPADLLQAARDLLAQPEKWDSLSANARGFYREVFSLERLIRSLTERAKEEDVGRRVPPGLHTGQA